jgi:membrane associated rhomboid family serine protease
VLTNLIVFFIELTMGQKVDMFLNTWGANPAEITGLIAHGLSGDKMPLATLFTAQFLHAGILHVGGNMLFLWIFGDNIEQRFGSLLYLIFYLGTGLAASMAHVVTSGGSMTPSVGASGAISGVMGAYILLYPRNRVRVFIWYWGIVFLPAYTFLGIWFLMQFLNGLAQLSVQTAQSSGVAFWAHIGGFVAGVVVAMIVGPLRRDPVPEPVEFPVWQDRDRW